MAKTNTAQLTPVSAAIVADMTKAATASLAENTIASLRADGAAFYEGESALKSFANLMRSFMTTATNQGDYASYIEASRQWRIGYEQAKRNTSAEPSAEMLSERGQKAFERRIKEAMSEALLGDDRIVGTIPKSASPDALRKAAAREAAQKAIQTAIGSASLVELGKKAAQAKKAEAAAIAAATKAAEAKAAADRKGDAEAAAKAQAKVDEAREAAQQAHNAAKTAQLHVETKEATVRKAELEAQAKRVKEFRERARALLAEANEVQLIAVIKALESSGVKTAEEKKAEAKAAADAAQAKADHAKMTGEEAPL